MGLRKGGGDSLSAALLLALALLAVAAFAITRAARAGDDIVNAVSLSPRLAPGAEAEVAFTLTRPDASADVLIIDSSGDRVRALELDAELAAARQELSWDGLADDGQPAPPGRYALRVVLGDQGRDIQPPGRIRVLPGTAG